jgi:tRNA A-37 threonylcarbamoyl transferase component Bud32
LPTGTEIAIGVGALAVFALLATLCKKIKKKKTDEDSCEKLLTEDLPHTSLPHFVSFEKMSVHRVEAALTPYTGYQRTHAELEAASGGFSNVLGQGAFATVYLGTLKGEKVAIKVDSPALAKADEKTRMLLENQFVYEVRTLLTHQHPNICALIAHCTDGPTRCLVYECCDGGNLFDAIVAVDKAALTWVQRVRIAVGIARGLAFLHANKPNPIVHRDVKTTNILLDANLEAKVSDFGTIREQELGVHTNIANANTHVTTKVVIGTDSYMPPECKSHRLRFTSPQLRIALITAGCGCAISFERYMLSLLTFHLLRRQARQSEPEARCVCVRCVSAGVAEWAQADGGSVGSV